MKKRFVSFLAILLLTALLSSCTAGLPGSELYFAARDAIAEFSQNLELLLAGDITIVQNGTTSYRLLSIHDPGDEVRDLVENFQTTFKKRTGAELRICDEKESAPKILISPQSTELPDLDANSFYVGFVGEDLVIHAENTIMLSAALSYVEEELLSRTKDGTLALSGTLSHISSTQLCENGQYVITRAEAASESAISAISKLYDALHQNAGARFSIKSDFNTTGSGAKEFLVGTPDRVECDAILPLLHYSNYYIGCTNEKIMILASSDQMLDLAVDKFIETFVTASNAICDKEQKSIVLPAECHYLYKVPGALLANEGRSFAVLLYPQNTGTAVLEQINRLCAQFQRLTNTTLAAFVDTEYERKADTFEILVGNTNRAESKQYAYDVKADSWIAQMGRRSLVLLADNDEQMLYALRALSSLLTDLTAKASAESIFYHWSGNVIPGVNRILFLPQIATVNMQITTPQPRTP